MLPLAPNDKSQIKSERVIVILTFSKSFCLKQGTMARGLQISRVLVMWPFAKHAAEVKLRAGLTFQLKTSGVRGHSF